MQQAQSRSAEKHLTATVKKEHHQAVQLQSTGERINIVYPKLGYEEVLNRQFIN